MNKFDSLDLADVQVAGEIGRRIDLTLNEFVLNVDVDKVFLDPIRRKEDWGFEKMASGGYLGLGKFIDAAIHFAKYNGDSRVIALKTHLIDEVLRAQLADGYLGVMQPSSRLKCYWDLHEMVYLIHALVNDYRLFGLHTSLEGAIRAADYIMEHRTVTAAPMDLAKLNIERAFLALSEATASRKYQDYTIDGVKLREWREEVGGQHAYGFMNLCLAQLDLYEREPTEILLDASHRVVDFLTRQDGLLIHGSCSRKELFHDDQEGTIDIAETCATAYLIRLLDRLMRLEANPLYGDLMERAIFNALFAAQSIDGRKARYHTPIEGKRQYCTERWPELAEHTFCCPNNFRRIMAQLPGLIYYHSDTNGILINLYTLSQASIRVKNTTVRVFQKTDYPTLGKVEIKIDPDQPATFSVSLRIPAWCQSGYVSLNGMPKVPVQGGSFCRIEREWQTGDRIILDLPMKWRWLKGRKIQAGRVALMRGSALFCLNPNAEDNRDLDLNPKEIVLDVESLSEPINAETIRPGGIACRVKGWRSRTDEPGKHDLDLLFTEFPDPGGEAVYFLPSEQDGANEDELIEFPKTIP